MKSIEFTERELTSWLRHWLSRGEAQAVARALLDETGGAPAPIIYKLLYDDTIWP